MTEPSADNRPRVYLCMPHYGQPHPEAAKVFWSGATRGRCRIIPDDLGLSALPQCFNELWRRALDLWDGGAVTHFAMLHADVIPAAGFVDDLMDELQACDADVMSAAVAIKDERGLTSTAIDNPADPWAPERRLTLHETGQLPATFTAADAGYPGRALLVNTGCWLVKLGPWCDEIYFEFRDRIIRDRNGRRQVQFIPEDWGFSRRAHRLGVKVMATSVVKVQHAGQVRFNNHGTWGSQKIDQAFTQKPLPVFQKQAQPERELVGAVA